MICFSSFHNRWWKNLHLPTSRTKHGDSPFTQKTKWQRGGNWFRSVNILFWSKHDGRIYRRRWKTAQQIWNECNILSRYSVRKFLFHVCLSENGSHVIKLLLPWTKFGIVKIISSCVYMIFPLFLSLCPTLGALQWTILYRFSMFTEANYPLNCVCAIIWLLCSAVLTPPNPSASFPGVTESVFKMAAGQVTCDFVL